MALFHRVWSVNTHLFAELCTLLLLGRIYRVLGTGSEWVAIEIWNMKYYLNALYRSHWNADRCCIVLQWLRALVYKIEDLVAIRT